MKIVILLFYFWQWDNSNLDDALDDPFLPPDEFNENPLWLPEEFEPEPEPWNSPTPSPNKLNKG
tara:strand:- start:622 stop:813 length:192 start_codon:yes stop_codon:yes gene_type:complete